ncbi:MAG: peptidoglycan-binding domain-containing protein, partial [Butyricicoccus sp.]
DDVRQVQEWLNILSEGYPEIKKLPVTGYFGSLTEAAVLTAQTLFGITPSGIVGPITWETLAQQSQRLQSNSEVSQ